MAELTGRRGRLFQGQGRLDAHVLREKNFYGGHGIVGAQVPLGTGIAFAHKYREQRRRLPHLSRRRRGQPGPGLRGLQHGRALEAAGGLRHREQQVRHGHLASSAPRRAPSSTSAARPTAFPASRSTAWTCWRSRRPARRRSQHAAPARARYILEALTYRYRGHSMSDPAKYRTKDEVQKMRAGARPDRARARQTMLIEGKVMRRGRAQGHRQGGEGRSSPTPPSSPRTSPEPDPSELYTDVLVEAYAAGRSPQGMNANSSSHAGPVADHDRGHAGQVAEVKEGDRSPPAT